MARFASLRELSPAGTVVTVDPTSSNSAKTEGAKDARAFVHVTALTGTLDIDVEISEDNVRFSKVAAFTQIAAIGNFVLDLAQEKVGSFTRLVYHPSTSATLEAQLEKKQGV